MQIEAIDAIYGKIEVRGLGIVEIPALTRTAPLSLVVDLVASRDMIERMPEPVDASIMGLRVPQITLYPFDASAPVKLMLALAAITRPVVR